MLILVDVELQCSSQFTRICKTQFVDTHTRLKGVRRRPHLREVRDEVPQLRSQRSHVSFPLVGPTNGKNFPLFLFPHVSSIFMERGNSSIIRYKRNYLSFIQHKSNEKCVARRFLFGANLTPTLHSIHLHRTWYLVSHKSGEVGQL